MIRAWFSPPADDYVDVRDFHRQRAIREAEYQAASDADAKVLRVSGKVPKPARRLAAIIERITRS